MTAAEIKARIAELEYKLFETPDPPCPNYVIKTVFEIRKLYQQLKAMEEQL